MFSPNCSTLGAKCAASSVASEPLWSTTWPSTRRRPTWSLRARSARSALRRLTTWTSTCLWCTRWRTRRARGAAASSRCSTTCKPSRWAARRRIKTRRGDGRESRSAAWLHKLEEVGRCTCEFTIKMRSGIKVSPQTCFGGCRLYFRAVSKSLELRKDQQSEVTKINRLVVALEHKATVCRMRKSVVSARSQERDDADCFYLQTVLFFFCCFAKVRFGFKTGPVAFAAMDVLHDSWNVRWINQLNYSPNEHLGVLCTKTSGQVEFEWSLFWATPFFEQELEVFLCRLTPTKAVSYSLCVIVHPSGQKQQSSLP